MKLKLPSTLTIATRSKALKPIQAANSSDSVGALFTKRRILS